MPRMNKSLFRLHVCGFIFTPQLIPTLFFLLILPLLIGLGFWQLDRGEAKQQLEKTFQQQLSQTPQSLASVLKQPKHHQFIPIKITGHYDNQHQFLVDNRMLKGKVGYFVLTPLVTRDHKIIMVNRGWIPRGPNRRVLPRLAAVPGVQTIVGRTKQAPQKIFLLDQPIVQTQWPQRIQAIDLKLISEWLGQPVLGFMVLLSPQASHGFVREWRPTTMKSHKHFAYAIQWFSLALTLVIIYIVVNTSRGRNAVSRKKDL